MNSILSELMNSILSELMNSVPQVLMRIWFRRQKS